MVKKYILYIEVHLFSLEEANVKIRFMTLLDNNYKDEFEYQEPIVELDLWLY